MMQLLLLLCVLLNMFTHATEMYKIDEKLIGKTLTNIYTKAQENLQKNGFNWFQNLNHHDKDNIAQFLSQSIEQYMGINEDVVKDMAPEFGLIASQTQQLYEFFGLDKNDEEISSLADEKGHVTKMYFVAKIVEKLRQNVIKQFLTDIYTMVEENLKLPPEDECMICYQRFPVSLTLPCGHEICSLCLESNYIIYENENCPKCRAPFSLLSTNWPATIINIYPCLITPEIPLKDLQHAFPLICSFANLTAVTRCIKLGVDVNKKGCDGKFPLTFCHKIDVVKYLVNKGANVNQCSDDGATSLIINSQEGNLLVVEYLFKKGAFINEHSLFASSQNGHLHVTKFLVQNGVNVNRSVKPEEETALIMSSLNGHLPVVEYLVKNGADVNQPQKDGMAPLFASCLQNDHLPIVQYLVENNANVNQARNDGSTPLLISSQDGHLAIVKYLVENNANVNQPMNDGTTPLFTSSKNGHLAIVEYLIEHGADVNLARNDGTTPIFMSSQEGHLPVVEYLIEHGADVNLARNDGIPPLCIAICNKDNEVAKVLLKNNTTIEATKVFLQQLDGQLELISVLDELCKQIE